MRIEERNKPDSEYRNSRMTDDPLKGLLMDKGAADTERHIQVIQRKMTCVQKAMGRLVDAQRASSRTAQCDCMDLYLFTNKNADALTLDRANLRADDLLFGDLKAACVLEWRARHGFAKQHQLGPSFRLQPFDPHHRTHDMVRNYIQQSSPGFYKVLSAYETVRLTLNFSLKALRKIAIDLHKTQDESKGSVIERYDKETTQLSRKLMSDVDTSGELLWILQGLYFEM